MHKIHYMDTSEFDPNAPACTLNNIFGLPSSEDNSEVVLLPVPWEVTVSYHGGTARAPEYIFSASQQIDLYDADVPKGWASGFYMKEIDKDLLLRSDYLHKEAALYINFQVEGGDIEENDFMKNSLHEVNKGCEELNEWVYKETKALLEKQKFVGIIGGDHSIPLGYYKALGEKYDSFGILHIDAHMDLRKNFENFTYSHASIMYNALEQVSAISKLVSVGVRDYCQEELSKAEEEGDRIKVFFDRDMKRQLCEGVTWQTICDQIVDQLPEQVYLSLDVDGLDPKLCPNTGTPVPGGLEIWQFDYLITKILDSGKQFIGFDLVEVGFKHNDWDSNVGARLLFRLCNLAVREPVKAY